MMQDLSMSILDICNNSVRANAKNITITIIDDTNEDLYAITIADDGDGMDEETLNKSVDPFFTSRNTRNVGMGIPFFKELSTFCEGIFKISSQVNNGCKIMVTMKRSHIDRPPLGDLSETMVTLIQSNDITDYYLKYVLNGEELIFDTKEVKKILAGVSIKNPKVIVWLKEYLDQLLIAVTNF